MTAGKSTKECPFCGETIKIHAIKCRFCKEFLDGYTRPQALSDMVGQDKIDAKIGDNATGVVTGKNIQQVLTRKIKGLFIQAQGNVTLGKDERNEQWQLALNWDGKTRFREFDLANRDLSDLSFVHADFKKANLSFSNLNKTNLNDAILKEAKLSGADLTDANLYRADLSGADLSGAILYNVNLSRANLQEANLIDKSL